jgi:hypothetical protein
MVKFVLTSSRTIGALLWPSLKSYYPFVHCWQMQTHVSPLHLTVSNYVSRLFCYIFFHLLLPLSLRLLQLGCLTFLQSFSDSSHLSKTLLVMIPWSAAWVEIQLLLVGPICAKKGDLCSHLKVLSLQRSCSGDKSKTVLSTFMQGSSSFVLLFYLSLLGQRRMRNRHLGCGQEFPFCALG